MYAIRRSLFILALAICLIPAADGHAQRAPASGTAGGWAQSALTEARQGESAFWNPALPALPDAGTASFTPFAFDFDMGTGRGWPTRAAADLLNTFHASPAESREVVRAGRSAARGSVLWFASRSGGLVLAGLSEAEGEMDMPPGIAALLSGHTNAGFSADVGSLREHRSTTLLLSKAGEGITLPLLGHTWLGVAGRFTFLHQHAQGSISVLRASDLAALLPEGSVSGPLPHPDSAGVLASLMEVRSGRVFGVDVGMVANPHRSLLVSLSLDHGYQRARVSEGTLAYRYRYDLGGMNGGRWPSEATALVDVASLESAERERALALVRASAYPRLLRAGVAWDMSALRLAAAGAVPIGGEPSLADSERGRWSISVGGIDGYQPRLSLEAAGSGTYHVHGALSQETCRGILTVAARAGWGRVRSVGLSLGYALVEQPSCH